MTDNDINPAYYFMAMVYHHFWMFEGGNRDLDIDVQDGRKSIFPTPFSEVTTSIARKIWELEGKCRKGVFIQMK